MLNRGVAPGILASLWRKQCEGMMCGEVQLEGAFDDGNARVSCSESSTSTKKVTSGVTWKVRAAIARPANKYSLLQCLVVVTSAFGHCAKKNNIKRSL